MQRRPAILLALGAVLMGWLATHVPGLAARPADRDAVQHRAFMLHTAIGAFRVEQWSPAHITRPAPLVLYAPGMDQDAAMGSVQLADLARHGYVAIAFDDVSRDPAPAGESAAQTASRKGGFDLSSPAAYRQSFERAGLRSALAAAKGKAILDAVLAEPELAQRIDPARIGFLGYSFGGAAAVEQSLADPRLKAVVNLDGWLFGAAARQPTRTPYLLIYIDEDFPPADYLRSSDPAKVALAQGCAFDQGLHRLLLGQPGFYWLHLAGAYHEDLTGQPRRWNWRRPLRVPDAGPSTLQQGELTVIRGFLDRYVKGDARAFPPPDGRYPPGLRHVEAGQLLP